MCQTLFQRYAHFTAHFQNPFLTKYTYFNRKKGVASNTLYFQEFLKGSRKGAERAEVTETEITSFRETDITSFSQVL